MPLLGKQLLPRDFAAACAAHWTGTELVKAVAVGFGESDLFVGAYNDNGNGTRDSGIFEINIEHDAIGTPLEYKYRTPSLVPDIYEPVVAASVNEAFALYNSPFERNGKSDIRRWEPWFAYTEGIATFPYAWVYDQTHGVPTGPWSKTGRYLHKAICGVANYHLLIKKDMNIAEALAYATKEATAFGLDSKITRSAKLNVVTFVPPPEPTAPPKDGIGPRYKPNEGV